MAVMMRWWRRLRGGVWHYTCGRFEGSTIYMWVREPCSIPSTVHVLVTEDYTLPKATARKSKDSR